jgi:hypothetical protein
MIKTFLKHFVYENCIEVLFNNIGINFSDITSQFNAGDKFFNMTAVSQSPGLQTLNYIFFGVTIEYMIYPTHFGIRYDDHNVQFEDGTVKLHQGTGQWYVNSDNLKGYIRDD